MTITFTAGRAFEPGEEVVGVVRAEGTGQLVISLLWFTSGRGTEDVQIVAQERRALVGAEAVPFRFALPESPWSFSGTLITLSWAVAATVEPGGAETRAVLVCAPGGVEVRL